MLSVKNNVSRSPPPEQGQQQYISDISKKLMNRNELCSVITNKFVKDNPTINEQIIENVVKDYLFKLNNKLNQLNLKELKSIIQEIAQQQQNMKKTSSGLNSSKISQSSNRGAFNYAENLNQHIDQDSQNQIQCCFNTHQNLVKKVTYPQISQNQRIGRSLSPKSTELLSTTSSIGQYPQIHPKSTSNSQMAKQERIKSPMRNERDLNKLSTQDLQNQKQQQSTLQSLGVKSILKKSNRSLSPLRDRQLVVYETDDKKFQEIQKKRSYSPTPKKDEIVDIKFNHTQDEKQKRSGGDFLANNQSHSEKQFISQRQLDDSIKDMQKNFYHIINGQGAGEMNKNSFWAHLEKIQKQGNENEQQQNQNEWRRKFDEIKNLRMEHQIQEELKKERIKNLKYNLHDENDDDDLESKCSTKETVMGYEMSKQKGILCDLLSQQQYIDINYAESVKRNLDMLSQEEDQEKKKKLEQKRLLREYYDAQVQQKKSKQEEETQKDKQFIVISQIIQEQEKREKYNQEINQMVKKIRGQELNEIEKDRQIAEEKRKEANKQLQEQFQREIRTEKEGNTLKKKEEQDFYQSAIKELQTNNVKAQKNAEEKNLDRIYMENYTNYLDQQEEQRLITNQKRQREIQQFLKKQAENHPKLREKRMKEEEREQIKQKAQEIIENDRSQKYTEIQFKRKLQDQLRNFLAQQIEEKKGIQQKNYIDYDQIQLEACQKYNEAQKEYENKISELRKQQEQENVQYLEKQIQENQLKNTKYFYPIAYKTIVEQQESQLNNSQLPSNAKEQIPIQSGKEKKNK